MRILVLGAGLQGAACAYDLLRQDAVSEVALADRDFSRLPKFLDASRGDSRLKLITLDATDHDAVARAMAGAKAVCSALPYYFNFDMLRLAIDAGAHFCDLGGNTTIVGQQRTLDAAARARGVTAVPDTGLAPGMVNILAQMGIARCDETSSVRIFVGGLPQHPEGVLKYQVVYSLEGALDYYTSLSWVLRNGKRTQVEALSELEPVKFDAPVGELEAFHTAGGLSTMAERYEGRIEAMEYKTLRYPGHAALMAAIRELGLIDPAPVTVRGVTVAPRDVAATVMTQRLTKPNSPDLVALRVVVEGRKDGKPIRHTWQLVDRQDPETGISAMERTTGFSLAITGLMQAQGKIAPPGVHTPDECMPGDEYVAELGKRGVHIGYTAG